VLLNKSDSYAVHSGNPIVKLKQMIGGPCSSATVFMKFYIRECKGENHSHSAPPHSFKIFYRSGEFIASCTIVVPVALIVSY
jgi:hypothetical protein